MKVGICLIFYNRWTYMVIIAVMLWSFNKQNLLINLLITAVVYVLLVIVCYNLTKKFSKHLKNK